jgi:hypothetical protein
MLEPSLQAVLEKKCLKYIGRYCIVFKRSKGRLAQLVERFVYTEEVSQVRALYRPPFLYKLNGGSRTK